MEIVKIVEELLRKGKSLFQQRRWDEAESCYTNCIIITRVLQQQELLRDDLLKAYSNRAETRLRKRNFDLALKDCNAALQVKPNHAKSLTRKGRALNGLEQYAEACNCLKIAYEASTGNRESTDVIQAELRKARDMCARTRQGQYDILDYVLRIDAPIPEVSDFVGDVRIRKLKGRRGLGLYATERIIPGQLLLVSNAVAVVYDEPGQRADPADLTADRRVGSENHLVNAVITVARRSKTLSRLLYNLDAPDLHEDAANALFDQMDSETLGGHLENENLELDRNRILEIIRRRSFGGVQQTFASKSRLFSRAQHLISGLWLRPSFINHSCFPNSSRLEVGSTMFIHASNVINKGEEITISYFDTLVPLEQRQAMCESWGFKCECSRCKLELSLQAALQPITEKFGKLHNKALAETNAAQETHAAQETNAAQKPFPAILPECQKFAELFVQAEEIIRSSGMLKTEKNRNWIRASFASAYLAGTQSKCFLLGAMENGNIPSGKEVMKAIQNTVPGDIRTVIMVAQHCLHSLDSLHSYVRTHASKFLGATVKMLLTN